MLGLGDAWFWPRHTRMNNPGRCGPSLRVLGCRRSEGSRNGVTWFPRLTAPTDQLGQVEDSAQQVCSQVAATDRLLWEVLAMVDRDILHPI
jgi:hypothetical protein